MLSGDLGEALQFAMQVVVRAAEISQAPYLIDASFVHIDACHYYGRAHVDFAQYLFDRGAIFEIPAWTNTVPVSLVAPDIRPDADPEFQTDARHLAQLYTDLGARTVWTCAPYQLPDGPVLGDQIVGSESNAVTYFNSVVGARTNKYGDFLDVCAGLTGRVPFAGLHTDAGRRGQMCFDISAINPELRDTEIFCHVLGHLLGRHSGSKIPVIEGLPASTSVDSLKAISAASAASGGVAMFHAVGVTPEAKTAAQAFQGGGPESTVTVTADMLIESRDALSGASPGPLNMVALGTPHFSITEFERLVALIGGKRVHDDVTFYVSTSRFVAALAREAGWLQVLEDASVQVVVDTCTYFSPAVRACRGTVMTNSAKWAYYAPGMLPVQVAFGSLADCVESSLHGEIRRDQRVWEQ